MHEETRGPDDDAVRRAKFEIQTLVQEVVDLSKSEIEQSEFFAALLDKSIAALAAIGGVVWTIEEGGPFKLEYQVNLQQTGLPSNPTAQMQHGRLLNQIAKSGEAVLVPPHSGAGGGDAEGEEAAANPTEYLLVIAPIRTDRGVDGLVEVFQRVGARPTTQRGYQRFLTQMCEIAGEFLKTRRLRHFVVKQTLWEQLEGFTSSVHTRLDSRQTAYTIANEGRRLIGCDRVTVVLRKGGKYVVEAISGQDTFDKRSNVVRLLRNLSTVVARSGEDLWYTGDTANLAPQVEKAVNAYVDESHTKQIAVLPLREIDPHADDKTRPQTRENMLGAIVIEQLVDSRPPDGLLQRVGVVRRHSATALTNAQAHEGLFLLPLWRLIGKSRVLVTARNLPKTITALIILSALVIAMCVVPYDFTVVADGKLVPENRGNVFAALNGIIDEVRVTEGETVKKGQIVAVQRSPTLDTELVNIRGQIAKNREADRAAASKRFKLRDDRAPTTNLAEVTSELAQIREEAAALLNQQRILLEQREQLTLRSPIDGKVVTWDLQNKLRGRPVTSGQRLMEIADPRLNWELEVDMPESKMGHVARQLAAIRAEDPDARLAVTFILATHPNQKLKGSVTYDHTSAEVTGDAGNTIRMEVDFPQAELAKLLADPDDKDAKAPQATAEQIAELKQNLKVGADVKAKIHCGREPIGYVWFHELWEFIQSRILFRF